jgi:hypothetical protein
VELALRPVAVAAQVRVAWLVRAKAPVVAVAPAHLLQLQA